MKKTFMWRNVVHTNMSYPVRSTDFFLLSSLEQGMALL